MNVALIVPYPGKKTYQKDYDSIVKAVEANGSIVLSAEKKEIYSDALQQGSALRDHSEAHYEFIRKNIIASDAVIVEVTYEDFKMGHETTLALLYHKPVLVLSQRQDFGDYIHHPDFTAVRYDPKDTSEIIKKFLENVTRTQRITPRAKIDMVKSLVPDNFMTDKTIAVCGGIYTDIFNQVTKIPQENEVARSHAYKMLLGGKATNAAVAMARLGNKVVMLGQVGNDSLGTDLEAILLSEGIATDFVNRDSTHATGTVVMVVDDKAQFSTVVNEATNFYVDKAGVDRLFSKVDEGKVQLDCLYITLENQPEFIEYVIHEASKRNIFIFCDAAPYTTPLDPKILPFIDVVAPNQLEAQAMTGIAVNNLPSAEAATSVLIKNGAKEVIITLGSLGAYHQIKEGKGVGYIPAVRVKAVDESSAGDAFRAAFVTEYLVSQDSTKALACATKAGAFAVTRFGSYDSMPTHNELEFFVDKNT